MTMCQKLHPLRITAGLSAAMLAFTAPLAVAGGLSGIQPNEAFTGGFAGIEVLETSELAAHRGAGISFGTFFQNIINATGGESRTLVVLNGRDPVPDSGPGDLSSTDTVTTATRTQTGTATVTRTSSSTTSTTTSSMTITRN